MTDELVRKVRYAEALRAAIEAAEPFRTMSTFNQERWDMTVLLLDAAPEIVAVLEAAEEGAQHISASPMQIASRAAFMRLRGALDALNTKVKT